ncbi:hypothetical protein MTO96_001500 [Rhipicephalus appendiculatus]
MSIAPEEEKGSKRVPRNWPLRETFPFFKGLIGARHFQLADHYVHCVRMAAPPRRSHLSRGRAASDSKSPTDISRVSAITWDLDNDSRSRRTSTTRAASWYNGIRSPPAKTGDAVPPTAAKSRSPRVGLPAGLGRRIRGRRSSSESRNATGVAGPRSAMSHSSNLPSAMAFPDGAMHGAVTMPPGESLPASSALAYGS